MVKEINNKYIRKMYGADLPQENITKLIKTMKKYGDNYWWESKDPIEVAMYQIFENTLLVNFSAFHEGIEKLLDRPVWTHEFGLNVEGLKDEARSAICRIKLGNSGISDEKIQKSIEESIRILEDYCKKTGKQFLKVELPKED